LIIQPILDMVALCAAKGITNAILSPGSRCAPISLAFARHPAIHARTISDERSAAFIALGMAQQLEQPVVLVCTSGSAAYNYAPAVAEAFFQQIPLLVITADRPAEWIDQWDGQTIRQANIYGKHVKGSFDFPDEFSHQDKVWHANRICNEAINLANTFPAGPVHINIPLREPFYPEAGEDYTFPQVRQIEHLEPIPVLSGTIRSQLQEKTKHFKRVLIVPGQQKPDADLQAILDRIAGEMKAVVVTDTISNLQSGQTISFHDHFIGNPEFSELLKPDLVISFGKSIISKNLKLFLRKSKASHWHIVPQGYTPDTFQALHAVIQSEPESVLEILEETLTANQSYAEDWKAFDQKIRKQLPAIMAEAAFGEYQALHHVIQKLPPQAKLHVANSMSIRYVNFLGPRPQEIICNRGTSGIDGSNSTAVGCVFTTKDPVVLITGDMAFFYDRNAFWHNYPMNNLRIILLNNHAGGIFRLIDGPARQPELEEYFETKQALTAEKLAEEYKMEYFQVKEREELEEVLSTFFEKSLHPKILEIITDSPKNAAILKWVKQEIGKLI
jgi:2-succinyl-5-enolpyruvyl-6-hydroxy-3-cyclohexene-1-carboxylate synthase